MTQSTRTSSEPVPYLWAPGVKWTRALLWAGVCAVCVSVQHDPQAQYSAEAVPGVWVWVFGVCVLWCVVGLLCGVCDVCGVCGVCLVWCVVVWCVVCVMCVVCLVCVVCVVCV